MSWMWMALMVVLLILNTVTSAKLVGDDDMPRSHRIAQLALVWLVPWFGAIICLAFKATDTLGDKPSFDRTAFANNAAGGQASESAGSDFGGCSNGDADGACSD